MKSSKKNENLIEKVNSIENKVNTIDSRLVNVEEKVNIIDTRLLNVENKVSEVDTQLISMEKRHGGILTEHTVRFIRIERSLEEIQDKVALIPKMYDILDGFAMEVETNRMERIAVSHQMSAYDKRFERLEKAIKAKKV